MNAITHRELLSLIDLSRPFPLVSFDNVVGNTAGTLFDLGKARYQFVVEQSHSAASATIENLVSRPNSLAAEAFRGRLIAESNDSDRFEAWLEIVPNGIDQHPEYWLALGLWLSHNDRDREAVRAFGVALRFDPTDRASLQSLAAALNRLGEKQKAETVEATLSDLNEIFRLCGNANAEQAMWIAEQMQTLARPWESIAWYRYAFAIQGTMDADADALNQRAIKIRAWEKGATIEEIRDARAGRMLGFDTRRFPMPRLKSQSF
jgi:tetratricopeptide (TPR) repeat protein